MEQRKYIVSRPEDLPEVARALLQQFPESRVFAFRGEMGAGKTTFIKAICRELGVEDEALSPTFAIINEYHTRDGVPVYHFDFYRIRKTEEVFDIGYEDYLFSGHYCFLEWPDLVEDLLPEGTIHVSIAGSPDRVICF